MVLRGDGPPGMAATQREAQKAYRKRHKQYLGEGAGMGQNADTSTARFDNAGAHSAAMRTAPTG